MNDDFIIAFEDIITGSAWHIWISFWQHNYLKIVKIQEKTEYSRN